MPRIGINGLALVCALAIWPGAASALAAEGSSPDVATTTGPVPTNEAGDQNNALLASSYFDQFGPGSNGEFIPWIEEHISLIIAFPPAGDWYVSNTTLPVIGYHDVYIDFTNRAAVPLTPTIREEYVARVDRDDGVGYAGTFMDDINFAGANKPAPEVQSEESYRMELANLVGNVHNVLGASPLLAINAQYHDIWPLMQAHEPEVERALNEVNIVTKEFGVGPDSGITTPADYKEFTEFVDTLHERGIHVIMGGDGNTAPVEEYNLATYFLDNDGGDYINVSGESPESWWPGNDINLGSAVSPRERDPSGLWKREFTGGVVYTVEPGAASSQTVKAPPGRTWLTVEEQEVTEVTVAPGTGIVLRYAENAVNPPLRHPHPPCPGKRARAAAKRGHSARYGARRARSTRRGSEKGVRREGKASRNGRGCRTGQG